MRSHHTHFSPEDSEPTPRGERGARGGGERRGPRGGGRGPGGRGGRGPGMGRPGGWQQADVPSADDAQDWFNGRLPDEWFTAVDVNVDRDEITVIGTLAEGGDKLEGAEAEGRVSRWRSDTKEQRIEIAREAESRYQRKVSWGVRLGDGTALFTHLAAPVMTRLRQPERQVLDTLVDAGVARSRSDALAWSVRLVGQHADEWLGQLREAMSEVDKLRSQGPTI